MPLRTAQPAADSATIHIPNIQAGHPLTARLPAETAHDGIDIGAFGCLVAFVLLGMICVVIATGIAAVTFRLKAAKAPVAAAGVAIVGGLALASIAITVALAIPRP